MIRKIVVLCVAFFCCESVFAQHMDFEGISFDSSLEAFDKELVKHGFALVEEDEYDKVRFYRGLHSNMEFSVFIRFTQYSLKIYEISVYFNQSHYDRVKEYIEQKYCVQPVEWHHMMRNYMLGWWFRFVYDVADNGWIGLAKDNFSIYDNEFYCLNLAEVNYPKLLKKRDLKKWQKKYKNPLFYDENPAVKQYQ